MHDFISHVSRVAGDFPRPWQVIWNSGEETLQLFKMPFLSSFNKKKIQFTWDNLAV